MRHSVQLGHILGIPIVAHWSWLAVALLLAITIATLAHATSPMAGFALGGIGVVALGASILAHEFAHALVARRSAVGTRAITLFAFGGVASLDAEPPDPAAEVRIALAGPLVSALLALVAFGCVALEWRLPGSHASLRAMTAYVAIVNGALAAFNLLPAFPLDGGRVLRATFWHWRRDRSAATVAAAGVGVVAALALIAGGVVDALVTHVLRAGWWALIGTFLLGQALTHYTAAKRDHHRAPPLPVVPAEHAA